MQQSIAALLQVFLYLPWNAAICQDKCPVITDPRPVKASDGLSVGELGAREGLSIDKNTSLTSQIW